MGSTVEGDLVTLTTGGGHGIDGIVFDAPSAKKVTVAVVDPSKGPVFRTVHPDALEPREDEGANDRALRLLIKRTPRPAHRRGHAGSGAGHGRQGHVRGAVHRTSDH